MSRLSNVIRPPAGSTSQALPGRWPACRSRLGQEPLIDMKIRATHCHRWLTVWRALLPMTVHLAARQPS